MCRMSIFHRRLTLLKIFDKVEWRTQRGDDGTQVYLYTLLSIPSHDLMAGVSGWQQALTIGNFWYRHFAPSDQQFHDTWHIKSISLTDNPSSLFRTKILAATTTTRAEVKHSYMWQKPVNSIRKIN